MCGWRGRLCLTLLGPTNSALLTCVEWTFFFFKQTLLKLNRMGTADFEFLWRYRYIQFKYIFFKSRSSLSNIDVVNNAALLLMQGIAIYKFNLGTYQGSGTGIVSRPSRGTSNYLSNKQYISLKSLGRLHRRQVGYFFILSPFLALGNLLDILLGQDRKGPHKVLERHQPLVLQEWPSSLSVKLLPGLSLTQANQAKMYWYQPYTVRISQSAKQWLAVLQMSTGGHDAGRANSVRISLPPETRP